MTRIAHCLLWSLVLLAPAHAAGQTESGNISVQEEQNKEAASKARKEVEGLAELGLNISIRGLAKHGKLYPFAKLVFQTEEGEQMKTLGKKRGTELEPPDKWTQKLYTSVRKASRNDKLKAAAIFRLHEGKNKEGDVVRGLWALVDHRDHPPMIFFVPLIEQEDGEHKPGELVFRGAEQNLFGKVPGKSENDD